MASESIYYGPGTMTRAQRANQRINEILSLDDSMDSTEKSTNVFDFTTICGFFQKFSRVVEMTVPNFQHLLDWVRSSSEEVPKGFRDLLTDLFRKNGKELNKRNFERLVIAHCSTYCAHDAEAVKAHGFQALSEKQKLRFVKELLESLFFKCNALQRFVEKQTSYDLRTQPLGQDRQFNRYVLRQNSLGAWNISLHSGDDVIRSKVVVTNRKQLLDLILKLAADVDDEEVALSDSGIDSESSKSSLSLPMQEEQQLLVFLTALSATGFEFFD